MSPPGENTVGHDDPSEDRPELDRAPEGPRTYHGVTEPSSSSAVADPEMVTSLYKSVLQSEQGMPSPTAVLREIFQVSQDRNEVVIKVLHDLAHYSNCLDIQKLWNPDAQDRHGLYPTDRLDVWYWAIRAGAADVIDILLEQDVRPWSEEKGPTDNNHLGMAVDQLRRLLSVFDENFTRLRDAVTFRDLLRIIDNLLEIHMDHDASRRATPYTRGTGLLHYLVSCPRFEFRPLNLKCGNELLKGREDGQGVWMPYLEVNECFDLSLAIHHPSSQVERGSVNCETSLHCAVYLGWKEMVRLLLQHGADPDQKGDRSGLTPYGLAKCLHLDQVSAIMGTHMQSTNLNQGDAPEFFDWWKGDRAGVSWDDGRRQLGEYVRRLGAREEVRSAWWLEETPDRESEGQGEGDTNHGRGQAQVDSGTGMGQEGEETSTGTR